MFLLWFFSLKYRKAYSFLTIIIHRKISLASQESTKCDFFRKFMIYEKIFTAKVRPEFKKCNIRSICREKEETGLRDGEIRLFFYFKPTTEETFCSGRVFFITSSTAEETFCGSQDLERWGDGFKGFKKGWK